MQRLHSLGNREGFAPTERNRESFASQVSRNRESFASQVSRNANAHREFALNEGNSLALSPQHLLNVCPETTEHRNHRLKEDDLPDISYSPDPLSYSPYPEAAGNARTWDEKRMENKCNGSSIMGISHLGDDSASLATFSCSTTASPQAHKGNSVDFTTSSHKANTKPQDYGVLLHSYSCIELLMP